MFAVKRAYDEPAKTDGFRVLVDRLWPRGVAKDKAKLDQWLKELAPSTALRQWFGHDPAKWAEFRKQYWNELKTQDDLLSELRAKARKGRVTLVFGAKDIDHNDAIALKQFLERPTKSPKKRPSK